MPMTLPDTRELLDDMPLADVVTAFLESVEERMRLGQISRWLFLRYRRECHNFLQTFVDGLTVNALTPDCFASAKHLASERGDAACVSHVESVRCMFRWAVEERGLLARLPAWGNKFGPR